jgi:hypothetical protein
MANKEDKQWALSTAISIILKSAEGGNQNGLSAELERLYKKLIELNEDANK